MTKHIGTPMNFEGFVAELTRAIRAKEPYSFTRYGDGEGLVLGYPDYTTFVNMEGRLNKWFDALQMNNKERQTFAEQMRQSVKEADMIGLPGLRHMEVNFNWRSVHQYLSNYDLVEPDKKVCCMDCVLELQVKGLYRPLFVNSEVKEVCCISCRDVSKQLKHVCEIETVNNFFLPPQLRPAVGPNLSPERHYPERYNKVQEWIDSMNPKGKVFLVGAGGLGKVYCMWIKRAGGIALDIGSVLDGWAGAATRSHISANVDKWRLGNAT